MTSLSFTRGLNVPKYDLPRYSKALEKALGKLLREAAREWLRMILANNVPVETGMAKATLRPLGEVLGIAVPISPWRKPYNSKIMGYRVSIPEGLQKNKFKIIDDRSNPGEQIFRFSWSTTVAHYWHSEFYKGRELPGDLNMEMANTKFVEIMNTGMLELPNYAQHMRVRNVTTTSEVPF